MSIKDQLKKIEGLYTQNIAEKGIDSTAVGWNSPDCQGLRFSKLCGVIEGDDAPISINDYGCGYGAQLDYLEKDLGLKVRQYNGYDISSNMLAAAKDNLKNFDGELNLLKSPSINTLADYSFVSGTFNVRFDASTEDWEKFIKSKLLELNECSRKGFAFNLLTSYVDYEEPHLYYGDPCFWFDYCKTNFSKYVSLIHDYPLWEWTILIRNGR